MVARVAGRIHGELTLQRGVVQAVWLPDLSGEDNRLAWTIIALGGDNGLSLIRPGDQRPRFWTIHRRSLEVRGKVRDLSEARLARMVDGSRIHAPDHAQIHGRRMFQLATCEAGSWGHKAGQVIVEPTDDYWKFAWSQRDGGDFQIPVEVWRRCGQKLAVWIALRAYARISTEDACTIRLSRQDIDAIEPKLAETPLSMVGGLHVKRAAKQVQGEMGSLTFAVINLGAGWRVDGIQIDVTPAAVKKKRKTGLDAVARPEIHRRERASTAAQERVKRTRIWAAEREQKVKRAVVQAATGTGSNRLAALSRGARPSAPVPDLFDDDYLQFDD